MAHNNLKTLPEIFNNKIFRIPDYQRGYAWGDKQLNDFWNDLNNLDDNRIHYTGMITVEEKDNIYFVIDGQQRLTTIIILLKVLLESFKDKWIGDDNGYEKKDLVKTFLFKKSGKKQTVIKPIFGYEKDNPSDCYFKKNILEIDDSECDLINYESIYTKNLLNAKEFFKKQIKNFSQEEIEKLILKILNQLKFNLYELDDELDEFVTFEVMNNRGKPLTTLELLKNRLIYLTTLFKDYSPEEISKLRNDINNTWKVIYEYLGKNPKKVIRDDDFLKDHWIMYFTYDRSKANAEKEFLLEKHFTQKNVLLKYDEEKLKIFKELGAENKIKDFIIDYNDIEKYIENIKKAVKVYFYILNPEQSDYSNEIKEWLKKLNIIGFRAFRPLIMAVLMECENLEEDKILEVLQLAEFYVFLVFIISKRRGDTGNSRFYKYANDFHKNKNIDKLIVSIKNELYKDENTYRWVTINNFIDEINNLFKNYDGWYSWKYLNYFLYEYEIYLQKEKFKEETQKVKWDDINKDSIEHIYPETSNLECWKEIFKGKNKKYLHSLGNLLLLSISKNASLGKKCFENKKKRYKNGSYSEIEVAQYEKWTPKEIYERGMKLLEFLSDRWELEISKEEKEKLLHIKEKDVKNY
jgi:hypothetical protein